MSDPRSGLMDDPRPAPVDEAVTLDQIEDARPQVAATRARGGLWLTVLGAVALGGLAFAWISASREHKADEDSTPTAASVGARETVASSPAPSELSFEEAAGRGGVVVAQGPMVPPPPIQTVLPQTQPVGTAIPVVNPQQSASVHAPTLVVDFAETDATAAAKAPISLGAAGLAAVAAKAGATGPNGMNSDEQFATRVGAEEPEHAQATQLRHRASLIPQGATITGVLETALNSDLPGFARAVVSRDVRGFDGTQILIPRGSRVIGQYKSAVAQGQTRAFVIWTRIIRPDGASIQIGSSGTDPLGRAGLTGKVDTHFFQRFGGAILLSVINAELTNLSSRSNNTQVVIGSASDATTASLSALIPTAIPPTIKVSQGAPIRIFVARDLDFSTVQRLEP